ncbi:hypothetical protein O7608_03000 [Solwaraspora sp. WMMA2056]|uniref:hypothetical protein n=1 Tax=Solwaraspora sp. WMMA2056 TaxID=3015161 RepID=UPI00259B2032|nr:hypothetical protein [Solwaraspora sp. WMMA2056]WJK41418.1 hypothetical protein O7608_03000 [Solwaraspora sp. WMMA2056]
MRTRQRPRGPGRPGTGRWGRGVAAVLAGLMVVTAQQTPVRAADPVAFDESRAQAALFAAAVALTGPDTAGLKNALITAELLDWRAANPAASSGDVAAHAATARTLADQAVPDGRGDQQTRFALASAVLARFAAEGSPATVDGPAVRAFLTSTVGTEGANVVQNALDLIRGGYQDAAWNTQVRDVAGATWRTLHQRAATDDALAAGWDAAFAARTGTGVRADESTLLAVQVHPPRSGNPGTLGHYVPMASLRAASGAAATYQALVEQQATRVLTVLHADGDTRITEVVAYSTTYVLNQDPKPDAATREAERIKTESNKKIFEGLGETVNVLSTLMGFVDPRFGKQLQTIGKAVVTSVTAINSYLTTVLGQGLTAAATAMGTAVLTGNLLGAAMSLVTLFTGGGPDPNALILGEIANLKKQINQLAVGMTQRFDRIETALNTMYTDLVGMLTELTRSVAEVRARIGHIATQLQVVERKIDSLALAVHVALQNIAKSELNTVITTYVHHKEIAGVPIPDYDTIYYPKAESPTFKFATVDALGEGTYTAPAGTSLADPVAVLDTYLPEGAINYLTSWANERIEPDLPNERVANPAAWSTAARTYNILQLENPQYAARVSSARADAVAKTGEDINDLVRQFSAPGDDGATNELFDTLVQDYRTALTAWAAQVKEIEAAVRWNGHDVPLPQYDLWGTADQAVATRIPETSTMSSCSGTQGTRSVPATLLRATLPNAYHLADHGLPTAQRPQFHTCYEANFVNVVENEGPRFHTTSGDLQVTVRSRVKWRGGDWQVAQSATKVFPVGVYCSWDVRSPVPSGYCRDEVYYLNQLWNASYRASFETAPVAPVAAATTTARAKAAAMLAGRQRFFYRVLVDGSGITPPAGGHSWDNSRILWERGRDVTRAVRMLQAYSELGWAGALESDDAMNGMLFGTRALPSDWTRPRTDTSQAPNQHFSNAFRHALGNYDNCRQGQVWDPCADDMSGFDPRTNQPQYGSACPLTDTPDRPRDTIAGCLFSVGNIRVGLLADRYAYWSGRIAAGSHVEGLPKVTALVDHTRAVDANLH